MTSTSSTSAPSPQPDWLNALDTALDATMAPAETAEPHASATTSGSEPAQTPAEAPVDLFETHEGRGRPAALGTGDGFDTVDTLKLNSRDVEQYGATLSRAVMTAQLDERFVSADYLTKAFVGISALGMMPREQRVRIHGETGLPTIGSWAQVNANRDLARAANLRDARFQHLHVSTPMSAAVSALLTQVPDSPFGKTIIEVAELEGGQACRFRVHIDAWRDPGLIVRTTLDFDQRKSGPLDVKPLQLGKKGAWELHREIGAMIGSLANNGAAQLAFVVGKRCGQALTGVTQGIVGPIYFDGTVKPDIIQDLFEVAPNNLIACFTAYELHRDGQQSVNPAWDDPEDEMLVQLQTKGWSATVDKLWVCTSEMVKPMEKFAAEFDTTLKVRQFF